MNRPLAIVFAIIALIFTILGAVVVLSVDDGVPSGPAAPEPTPTSRVEREHAQPTPRRAPKKPAEAPLEFDETPLPEPVRLPVAPGTGFVHGTISDIATGDALTDATVRLLHPTGEEIARSPTDHAGRYVLEDVPEGIPLLLEIAAPGHLTGHCASLRLTPGEVTRKDAAMLRSPQITVSLRAMPWARAAQDVPVRIMDQGREVAAGTSDEFGEVTLAVAEFGEFQLRVGGAAWAPNPADDVTFVPGGGDQESQADVRRGGNLEIVVTNGLGEARSDASVTVHARGLEPVSGVTSSAGRVTLGPFPPGISLWVIASADEGRQRSTIATRARDRHDVEVPIVLRGAQRVRGTIVDDRGRPIARATIRLALTDDGPLLGELRTEADGSFTFEGVPNAEMVLRVSAAGFGDGARRVLPTDRGGSARLELQSVASARVFGTVKDKIGSPIAGVIVRVVPSDLRATTDKRGRFRIDGLPIDATQRIVVEADGYRIAASGDPRALLVTLDDGQKARVDITLIPLDSVEVEPPPEVAATIRSVRGRIVRGSGAPVASARIWWSGTETVTGPDGRFRLDRETVTARTIPRPVLFITPPAGLLEPLLMPLHAPDETGVVELENVGLRDRPSCSISLTSTPGSPGNTLAFALLFDGTDRLLGHTLTPFQGRSVVTYDGSWLHVAAAGAWRSGGHRRAYVGVTGSTGPLLAWADWPVAAGPSMGVTPEWRDTLTKSNLRVPRSHARGLAEFRLRRPPGGAPITQMGLPDHFSLRLGGTNTALEPLLGGVWDVLISPPEGAGGRRLATTITYGRMGAIRPAR